MKVFNVWVVIDKASNNLVFGIGATAKNAWENATQVLYPEDLEPVSNKYWMQEQGYRAKRARLEVL